MVEQAQMGKYKICTEKANGLPEHRSLSLFMLRTIEFNTILHLRIRPVNAWAYLYDMINANV